MNGSHVFEQLVTEALNSLPKEFQEKLNNVDVVIEEYPTPYQRQKMNLRNNMALFGLYEGIPQTKRGNNYTMVLPDKITIFQKSVEAFCSTDDEIKTQVRKIVLHELGHHFGMSDSELRKIDY